MAPPPTTTTRSSLMRAPAPRLDLGRWLRVTDAQRAARSTTTRATSVGSAAVDVDHHVRDRQVRRLAIAPESSRAKRPGPPRAMDGRDRSPRVRRGCCDGRPEVDHRPGRPQQSQVVGSVTDAGRDTRDERRRSCGGPVQLRGLAAVQRLRPVVSQVGERLRPSWLSSSSSLSRSGQPSSGRERRADGGLARHPCCRPARSGGGSARSRPQYTSATGGRTETTVASLPSP